MPRPRREDHDDLESRVDFDFTEPIYLGYDERQVARVIHTASDTSDLMKVARDYEHGMNYCIENMRYADYKRLMGWIEFDVCGTDKDLGWRLGPMSTTRFYGSDKEFDALQEKVESVYRDFEEGDRIIVFPEGKRWSKDVRVYTKDADLSELTRVRDRTSGAPHVLRRLAALPHEKARLLDSWIEERLYPRSKVDEQVLTVVYPDREECYTANADSRSLSELRVRVRKGEIPLSDEQKAMLDKWFMKQLEREMRQFENERNQRGWLPEI